MIDLTPVLQGLLGLLAALITGFVIPWIRSKTTEQQRKYLRMIIDMLVQAAEQLFGEGRGQDKLAYVKAELEKRGFTVDLAEIEAAVLRLMDVPSTMEYQIDGGKVDFTK